MVTYGLFSEVSKLIHSHLVYYSGAHAGVPDVTPLRAPYHSPTRLLWRVGKEFP